MAQNKWLKIALVLHPVLIDAVTDFFVGIVGAGVEVGVEEDIHMKTLNAYVEKENPTVGEVDDIINMVKNHCQGLAEIFAVPIPDVSSEVIEEQDWGQNWKKHFTPLAITPKLTIAPSWEHYAAQQGEHVIVMDPGMAFGTGHHATTALVLQLMEREIERSGVFSSVLDVGTGTGILGMAAVLYGASRVYGIDNDPVAVAVAEENIAKNMLEAVMQVSNDSVSTINEQYQLVVANIIHDVLVDLVQSLSQITARHGTLILSGILQGEQADSIIATFGMHGFVHGEIMQRDEWAALLFHKDEG